MSSRATLPTEERADIDIERGDDRTELLLPADSDQTPTLSVVMPTLDEEEGIAECISAVKLALRELGVTGEIIVSDDSTDRTPEIARQMGAIVVEPDGKGYGYAYKYAFEHVRGDYVAIGDADTTYDFEELPQLVRLVASGQADMAMGSRLEGEIRPGAMPKLHQYLGNPLLTKFLNVFYDAGVTDAHSGMRVIGADALRELNLKTDGMEFASEMIMAASAKGMTIEEIPITYHERKGDAKLESFHDGWRHVKFMLQNAPGYLFSIPGVLLAGIGVVIMAAVLFGAQLGTESWGFHALIGGSLLTIVGAQIASLGVFATVGTDPIRRPSDPFTTWITEEMNLERGATFGLALFTAGSVYGAWMVVRRFTIGYTESFLATDVVAFTAIVLGIQIIFSAFFLSTIAEKTQ